MGSVGRCLRGAAQPCPFDSRPRNRPPDPRSLRRARPAPAPRPRPRTPRFWFKPSTLNPKPPGLCTSCRRWTWRGRCSPSTCPAMPESWWGAVFLGGSLGGLAALGLGALVGGGQTVECVCGLINRDGSCVRAGLITALWFGGDRAARLAGSAAALAGPNPTVVNPNPRLPRPTRRRPAAATAASPPTAPVTRAATRAAASAVAWRTSSSATGPPPPPTKTSSRPGGTPWRACASGLGWVGVATWAAGG